MNIRTVTMIIGIASNNPRQCDGKNILLVLSPSIGKVNHTSRLLSTRLRGSQRDTPDFGDAMELERDQTHSLSTPNGKLNMPVSYEKPMWYNVFPKAPAIMFMDDSR